MSTPAPRFGRKFVGSILCVGASVILAGCAPTKAEEPKRVRDSMEVIDGDTFRDKLSGEVVRISNIDAPEMPGRARCWAEARLALEARDALAVVFHMANGDDLQLVHDDGRERDQYGRLLGRVILNGEDVGEHMVERGLAAPWTGKRWDWCAPTSKDPAGAALLKDRWVPTY